MYKISPDVFYQIYGEEVYLRKVDTRRDYVFNEIVKDILDNLKTETSFDILLVNLQSMYNLTDVDATDFQNDIASFLNTLVQDGIVIDCDAKTAERANVLIPEQFREKCAENHQLWSVGLEITYRCNEKCIHCYVDNPINAKEELTYEEYQQILDTIQSMGCMHVLITGGECTLRPDFLDICRYAVMKGLLVDVYTNGLHLTDEMIDELCNMHVNSVSFSLYGGDAETHEMITQVPGSFEKTLCNIMIFKCRGIDIFAKSSITKVNFSGLDNLLKLGKKIAIPMQPNFVVTPTNEGTRNVEQLMLSIEEYQDALTIMKKYETDTVPKKFGIRDMNSLVCYAGLSSLSITPYGDILPCNGLGYILGNVRNNRLEDIWSNAPFLKYLQNFHFGDLSSECKSCQYSGACAVCLGAAYKEHKGEFKPCHYTCEMAKANFENASGLLDIC